MNIEINDCISLDISILRNLVKGWHNKDYSFEYEYLKFTCKFKTDNKRLIIEFTRNSQPHRQIIYLGSKPSNLGKGIVYSFICPVSGSFCRKLYLHKNSDGFASFKGYKKAGYPLMYFHQTLSKKDRVYNLEKRFNSKYIDLKNSKRKSDLYDGKITKTAQRLLCYELKQKKYSDLVLENMFKVLSKIAAGFGMSLED